MCIHLTFLAITIPIMCPFLFFHSQLQLVLRMTLTRGVPGGYIGLGAWDPIATSTNVRWPVGKTDGYSGGKDTGMTLDYDVEVWYSITLLAGIMQFIIRPDNYNKRMTNTWLNNDLNTYIVLTKNTLTLTTWQAWANDRSIILQNFQNFQHSRIWCLYFESIWEMYWNKCKHTYYWFDNFEIGVQFRMVKPMVTCSVLQYYATIITMYIVKLTKGTPVFAIRPFDTRGSIQC